MQNETTMDHIETAQQHQTRDQADAAERIEEVFRSFGEAVVQLEREQQAIRGTLTQIIEERALIVQLVERLSTQFGIVSGNQEKAAEAIVALGKFAPAMDERITLLSRLLDFHHDIFIAHGWANPKPKADFLAN